MVIGIVECRTREIVHRGVDDHEGVHRTRLHPDDLGQQHPGIACNQPARFEHQLDAPALRDARDHRAIGMRFLRHIVGAVGNTKPAAKVDMRDLVTRCPKVGNEPTDPDKRCFQRAQVEDLATDMQCHSAQVQPG